jgi:hypothetical protein
MRDPPALSATEPPDHENDLKAETGFRFGQLFAPAMRLNMILLIRAS